MALARIVFLNGPAGCGKDTIADILSRRNGWAHMKLSSPLKDALRCLLPFDPDFVSQSGKLSRCGGAGSPTIREALIRLSESYAKPVLGGDIFGRLLLARIEATPAPVVVVSDSRFAEELAPIVSAGHDAILIRLHRSGCTFDGDSGGYQFPTAIMSFDLPNNGFPGDAAMQVEGIVNCHLHPPCSRPTALQI